MIIYAEVSLQILRCDEQKRIMAVTVSVFFTELHIVTEVHRFLFSKFNHQMPAFISPFLVVMGVRKKESGDDLKVMGVSTRYPLHGSVVY